MAEHETANRIQRRLRRMQRLFVHVVITLVVTLGIVYGVDRLELPVQIEDAAMPVIVLLLIAHALWVSYAEMTCAIQRQETTSTADLDKEKPKHHLALGDDGELTEVLYDEDEQVRHGV